MAFVGRVSPGEGMKIAGWATISYAILLLIGGLIGYYKVGSAVSAIAGIASSTVLLACGLGVIYGKRYAIIISVAATLILDGFFSYRFMSSFSFMPAGMMALLSLITLLIQVVAIRKSGGSQHHAS